MTQVDYAGSRSEWITLRRARNALSCSFSVMPASILTSTALTAADASSKLSRPRGVSCAGRTFPTAAPAGLVT